ncbi:ribosome-recycling factor [Candidatus Nasuia deltocephalinicola]|uniref:ribosome-recycling factor n=1 Tax=Candidatus Nasuia deltocephalincola TaxID=1160784 RepID=UPI00216AC623|nr:ribosome-recycling factor [Candidatus Nasuia deltocephalinicola]
MLNKNFENLKIKINKLIELFENKIKKINLENNEKMVINEIKIPETGNIKKNLKDISEITYDEKNNIIVKPFEKENTKEIAKILKKIKNNINITIFKDFIKINKNIITSEKKDELIKIIKNEKESIKILIRGLRKKENEKWKDNIKEKKMIQKIIDENINIIDKIISEKIKNIK